LSDQELIIEEKKRKGIFIVFSVFIGLMIGVSIFGFGKKEYTSTTIMPMIVIPLYLMNWRNYKDAKNEIKSRNIKLNS
jgi:hypothetical protein